MNLNHSIAGLALLTLCAACASHRGAQQADTLRFAANNDFVLTVPEGTEQVRAWFALPAEDEPLQTIERLDIATNAPAGVHTSTRKIRDRDGNRFLELTATGAAGKSIEVTTSFDIVRSESRVLTDASATRPLRDAEREEMSAYLGENEHVRFTPEIRRTAAEVLGNEKNPVRQARLIYDWVLEHVTYWVKDPSSMKSSGVGSSQYCYEKQCGNCTDFHSLYMAVARAGGLPTRIVYGSFFKGPLNGEDADQSYHCWLETWAPQIGWIPIDVAVADIFVDDFSVTDANARGVALTVADGYHGPDRELVDYYFGNLDARRVTWHRGRDLEVPGCNSNPINALPKAVVEFDGVAAAEKKGWTRKLTFSAK